MQRSDLEERKSSRGVEGISEEAEATGASPDNDPSFATVTVVETEAERKHHIRYSIAKPHQPSQSVRRCPSLLQIPARHRSVECKGEGRTRGAGEYRDRNRNWTAGDAKLEAISGKQKMLGRDKLTESWLVEARREKRWECSRLISPIVLHQGKGAESKSGAMTSERRRGIHTRKRSAIALARSEYVEASVARGSGAADRRVHRYRRPSLIPLHRRVVEKLGRSSIAVHMYNWNSRRGDCDVKTVEGNDPKARPTAKNEH
ncbi:hypothetical protein R3P38DRAFT_2768199 [Favolaschia claudopus]|uniref:Uncharacterized protein n=1 Tax=Favolaschia claudopus TaxID=2862362 RepID=A0AAW0CWS5_9AGAR